MVLCVYLNVFNGFMCLFKCVYGDQYKEFPSNPNNPYITEILIIFVYIYLHNPWERFNIR